ncbi:unnamed protein product [Timema podura]|uniref:Uncharacterized protein n=1 Tax=Timema podura TaxID=61482 RepID=A0ABN7NY85_TIMPD|nr:unnamed protein product [Timema podura]
MYLQYYATDCTELYGSPLSTLSALIRIFQFNSIIIWLRVNLNIIPDRLSSLPIEQDRSHVPFVTYICLDYKTHRETALQRLFFRVRGVMRRRHPSTFQTDGIAKTIFKGSGGHETSTSINISVCSSKLVN